MIGPTAGDWWHDLGIPGPSPIDRAIARFRAPDGRTRDIYVPGDGYHLLGPVPYRTHDPDGLWRIWGRDGHLLETFSGKAEGRHA